MSQAQAHKPQPWHMPKGYLNSPFYDHVLIFGIAALAIITGVAVNYNPDIFMPIFIADLWLLGYHHVISTFTKLAGTKEDRKENRFLIYILPFIVLSGVFAMFGFIGVWAIVTTYFFWQWFHYTRQAYGISAFYRRKAGITETVTPARLDYAAIWAVPIAGVVHRCAQGWEQFLFLPVKLPSLSPYTDALFLTLALGVFVWWLATKFIDFARGNLAYAPFFFVLSHQVVFAVSYILINDITIGWLVVNIWHNAQYILFVWLFNQNRFGKVKDKSEQGVMYWLSQRSPYRTFMYFAACLVATTVIYKSINFGTHLISGENVGLFMGLTLIFYQSINFHHYIVDGLIWKARKKQHQKIMDIKS